MRICIFGDTGDGKTLSLVNLLIYYYNKRYKIYSNLTLKGLKYTKIDTINFDKQIKEINEKFFDKKYVIGIDEVGEEQSGKPQLTFSHMLSQSRKTLGEKHHLILTTQTLHQTNTFLLSLLDFIIYPEILYRNNETGKPIILRLDYFKKIKRLRRPKFEYITSVFQNVFYSCDKYATDEIVEPLKDDTAKKFIELYKDFVNKPKNRKILKIILQDKHGFNKTSADEMAVCIVNAKDIYPELFKDNKLHI